MAYHFDSFTHEPVRCTFAYGCCPVASVEDHYCNISEAVQTREAAKGLPQVGAA